jgi:hypothetical protein
MWCAYIISVRNLQDHKTIITVGRWGQRFHIMCCMMGEGRREKGRIGEIYRY